MAVNSVFNSLRFGGIDSADYGIFINGEGVYNAPERSVEMVAIPGRNGALAIDQGRFENIEVTYPAGTFGDNQEDFAVKLSAFQNAVKTLKGYQRLTDTYHPDVYRMGVFIDAIEVSPTAMSRAGEFNLVFNCKPQRYLVSGEEAVTLFPNAASTPPSVINPTLFDAEPLFEVEGYGTFDFGEYTIDLHDPYRGETVLVPPKLYTYVSGSYPNPGGGAEPTETFYPMPSGNQNDAVTINQFSFYWLLTLRDDLGYSDEHLGTVTVTDSGDLTGTTTIISRANRTIHLRTVINAYTLPSWATSWTYKTHTVSLGVSYTFNGADSKTVTFDFGVGYKYTSGTESFEIQYTDEQGSSSYDPLQTWVERLSTKGVSIDSTVFILGTPTYVDCELGDAYMIENGEYKSLNDHIGLGSDLPKLKPGETQFYAETSITGLDIVPRWWKL